MALTDILNYVAVADTLATSGQPEPEQFSDIARAGFQIIINLAMDNSDRALEDEAECVQKTGLKYYHIPVPFDAPGIAHLHQFFQIMHMHEEQKIWVHCVVNYRASAFIYQYLKTFQNCSEYQARSALLKSWQPDTTWKKFMALRFNDFVQPQMKAFLQPSHYVDWHHPAVLRLAQQLAEDASCDHEIIKKCYELVRDTILHSADFQQNPVTCKASDVLRHNTGYCYAKSHLLAALLRANAIPTGLCYQRLSVKGKGPPFSLHGLNSVYLNNRYWYRIDARGNKTGVEARFTPPVERIAFPISLDGERDLPEIWHKPHPAVIQVLEQYDTWEDVYHNLPDIELLSK